MNDIYKLDYLGGMTVGASQGCDNFAEVIDHLFEKYPYKDVLKLLGFDSISDLSEYLTGGNYDEGQARELCKDVLDGSDLDDIDPETEHGDEMRDRLAGK